MKMKPSSLLRLRNIWIMSCWLRNEAITAAAMVVRRRDNNVQQPENDQKHELEAGQVGVDAQGKLRIVRVMDDYIIPAECGF
ncbi:uncharacterized protein LOC117792980 [Drosophila innubila]|uniref:uncharacterized protein LOC117792980 n=1 Tax=Drosophila innubila TaxID=198719 RepID=UPI00148B9C7D|nr:uncharacterized protein LOC117792980 [Drosophila innubila]